MSCELVITYRPARGSLVPLAAITDRHLLAAAAEQAIRDSEIAAAAMAEGNDLILAEMQRLEARRLRDLLGTVLPELAAHSGPAM
jgi:hypothetical protein